MSGIWSLSVSPLNPICMKRARKEGSVCSKCYSMNMQKCYSALSKCLERNLVELTNKILANDELPEIKNRLKMFRFESFGDIVSETQALNYFNICEANPEIDFALWTKNPWIIAKAMDIYKVRKPVNITIIGSSYNLNKPMVDYYKRYDFVDHIFTVYDKEFIKHNNVEINCGGASCKSCQKCYRRKYEGYEIREKLK